MNYEDKFFPTSNFETRSEDGATAPTKIVGYAAVFGEVSYGEKIKRGAFKKTLKDRKDAQNDIRAYWQHNPALPLGRTSNGTLTLEEDTRGLYVEITPNLETSFGRDAMAAITRGDVLGMSFGFRIISSRQETIDGQVITELTEIDLREVSPVTEPWYPQTVCTTRDEPDSPGEAAHDEERAQLVRAKTAMLNVQLVIEENSRKGN